MALSQRLRFEILRRDGHTCRYCGQSAPDVKLTVDHVVPVALGGSDDPDNLVTACQGCNAGKSSIAPDQPIVDAVDADALRWAAAMKRAAEIQSERADSREIYIHEFDKCWEKWKYEDGTTIGRPGDWATSVGYWHDIGFELHLLLGLVDDVAPRRISDYKMWKYFCGAVWRTLRERQELAETILQDEDLRD